MSRRHAAEKREILPDPKFGDRVLSKFMNNLMIDGKKSIAEGIVYGAFERVEGKLKRAPVEVFHEALENIKPSVEVKSRRVGGATYQVPVEVRPDRREALAIRWMIGAARKRNENTMVERLAGELMDAINSRGTAVKKREDTHKMAEAGRTVQAPRCESRNISKTGTQRSRRYKTGNSSTATSGNLRSHRARNKRISKLLGARGPQNRR